MPKGDPRTPLDDRELHEKFHRLAGIHLPRERAEALAQAIMHIEDCSDVNEMLRAHCAG